MKKYLLFYLLLNIGFLKGQVIELGNYEYTCRRFSETLILHADGTFLYNLNSSMGNDTLLGNWQQRNEFLILDSYPQKDKIIVYENFDENNDSIEINVEDKNNLSPLFYDLTVLTLENDTITFKNRFYKTKIPFKIKSFWISNRVKMKSPVYKIKNLSKNKFHVLFENERGFENEHWIIVNEKEIKPLTAMGIPSNYNLLWISK